MREWLLIGCACAVLSCSAASNDGAGFSPGAGLSPSGGVTGVGGTYLPASGGAAAGAGGNLGAGGGSAGAGGDPGAGGVAPSGGGGIASGVGGSVYDPNVTFDWPQTTPPAGSCEAGTYQGTFTCDVTLFPGLPPGQVAGPLTFALTPSANGEFLEINNGRMDANAVGTPFGADLSGKLDCSTRTFHADTLIGSYGTAPFLGQFFGSLDGTLNGLTNTLSGTWHLAGGTMAMPTGISCQGTWSSVRQ